MFSFVFSKSKHTEDRPDVQFFLSGYGPVTIKTEVVNYCSEEEGRGDKEALLGVARVKL